MLTWVSSMPTTLCVCVCVWWVSFFFNEALPYSLRERVSLWAWGTHTQLWQCPHLCFPRTRIMNKGSYAQFLIWILKIQSQVPVVAQKLLSNLNPSSKPWLQYIYNITLWQLYFIRPRYIFKRDFSFMWTENHGKSTDLNLPLSVLACGNITKLLAFTALIQGCWSPKHI